MEQNGGIVETVNASLVTLNLIQPYPVSRGEPTLTYSVGIVID